MIVYCDKCKYKFSLDSKDLTKAKVKEDQIMLTYFVCSKCNTVYVVSLLDDECIRLQKDFEQANKRLKRNRNNSSLYTLLSNMVDKKLKRFKKYADSLKQKFDGTFTFASDGDIIYREKDTDKQ